MTQLWSRLPSIFALLLAAAAACLPSAVRAAQAASPAPSVASPAPSTAAPMPATAVPAPATTTAPTLQQIVDQRTSTDAGTGILIAHITPSGIDVTASGTSGTARPLDAHTLFEIGSVSKTFTATLLATMVLDGSVKLDDPIAKYVPAGVHVPTHGGKAITLLDLATQHSGLPRLPTNDPDVAGPQPYATYDDAKMFAFLSSYKLPRDPGAGYEYSNYAVGLLGELLAHREHTTYAALLRKRVLAPLGMTETTVIEAPLHDPRLAQGRNDDGDAVDPWIFRAIAPAGGIVSSLSDMEKYARCQMGTGPLAKACLFAQRPRTDLPGGGRIGLIWMTTPRERIVNHPGDTSSFHAAVAITANHREAAVVLANGGLGVEDLALHQLLPTLAVARAESQTVPGGDVGAYVGTYVAAAPPLTYTATNDHGRLRLQLSGPGQPSTIVTPTGKDTFAYKQIDARVKFVRDASGAPTALVLEQNGAVLTFVRPGAAPPSSASTAMFPPVVALDLPTLSGYVGTYRAGGADFTVTLDGTQLMVKLTGQPAVPVYPSAKDAFFYKVVTANIDFTRNAAGAVTTLTLQQGGRDISAARI